MSCTVQCAYFGHTIMLKLGIQMDEYLHSFQADYYAKIEPKDSDHRCQADAKLFVCPAKQTLGTFGRIYFESKCLDVRSVETVWCLYKILEFFVFIIIAYFMFFNFSTKAIEIKVLDVYHLNVWFSILHGSASAGIAPTIRFVPVWLLQICMTLFDVVRT